MIPVAKRQIAGLPAPANGYDAAAAETKRFTLLIHNLEIAFDANRTVIENGNFSSRHRFLPQIFQRKCSSSAYGTCQWTAQPR
jgi:hypothetical protein